MLSVGGKLLQPDAPSNLWWERVLDLGELISKEEESRNNRESSNGGGRFKTRGGGRGLSL